MKTVTGDTRILGIDPGTATVGFGLIDLVRGKAHHLTHGVIRTAAGEPPAERLHQIATDLRALIKQHQPGEMAVEELFFAKNTTTAIGVAQARGVILAVGAEHGLSIGEYTPMQVKQAIGGSGGAAKSEMQEMVRRLLSLDDRPAPDDAADALAVALTHAVRRKLPKPRPRA